MLVYEKRTPKCNFINLLDLFNIKRKHFGTLSVNNFQTCDKINIMIKPSFEIPLFKAQWVRCIIVYNIKESWWLNIFFLDMIHLAMNYYLMMKKNPYILALKIEFFFTISAYRTLLLKDIIID